MALPPVPVRAAPPPPAASFVADVLPPVPARAAPPPPMPIDGGLSPQSFEEPEDTGPAPPPYAYESAAAPHPIVTHQETKTLFSALSGLGLGSDSFDEGGGWEEGGHDGFEEGAAPPDAPPYAGGNLPAVSRVTLGPPSAADTKRTADLITVDWFDERANTPARGFARSAYDQDAAAMSHMDWSQLSGDERDTWRFLVLSSLLSEKEQMVCDLALLRTLWLPAFGVGVKKSKIKKVVNDPLFSQLDEQTLEMYDRHRNLVAQLAQQRDAFFATRSFGELVLKLANYAAKIDVNFVQAFPQYVAGFEWHLRATPKLAKFVEKQKANPDLAGKGSFVDHLRGIVEHFNRCLQMFQHLSFATDPSHPDYAQTQKALMVMLGVGEALANVDAAVAQHLAVGELEPLLDPAPKGFYAHERRLLRRAPCSYFVKDKKRAAQKTCEALLFNDLLLLCESTAGTGKSAGSTRLSVLVTVELDDLTAIRATKDDITQSFKDLEQAQVEMATAGLCLVYKKDRKELFFLNSVDEKEAWNAALLVIMQQIKVDALHRKATKK